MTEAALFGRQGDLYQPSPLTVGPWSPDAQHGGPPAALLARAIETTPADVEMTVVRVAVDLLRPVPIRPLRLTSEVVRPGKRVQLLTASLSDGDQEVARAFGLRIRRGNVEVPGAAPEPPPPGPERGEPAKFFDMPGAFATEAVEIRMLEGDFSETGPGRGWIRLRVPLVEGEETTPVQRLVASADFGNGMSNMTGTVTDWLFINPDLEVRMYRPPVGEWFCLDSVTRLDRGGAGLATSLISDADGVVGVAAQSLFVDSVA